jgi:hypothetical protein
VSVFRDTTTNMPSRNPTKSNFGTTFLLIPRTRSAQAYSPQWSGRR